LNRPSLSPWERDKGGIRHRPRIRLFPLPLGEGQRVRVNNKIFPP